MIYPLNGDVARHFEPGTVGFYNIEEGSNSWRKEGRLSPGTTVKILEVNRYLIDARGLWVGVVCLVQDPETHREVKFLYCWSSGDFLERAPWEDESIPERRDIRALP